MYFENRGTKVSNLYKQVCAFCDPNDIWNEISELLFEVQNTRSGTKHNIIKDGFELDRKVGAEFFREQRKIKLAFRLNDYYSVFRAELIAIIDISI